MSRNSILRFVLKRNKHTVVPKDYFMAALFITEPMKQPKCPEHKNRYINWYLCILESYMTLKRTKYSYMNLLIIYIYQP